MTRQQQPCSMEETGDIGRDRAERDGSGEKEERGLSDHRRHGREDDGDLEQSDSHIETLLLLFERGGPGKIIISLALAVERLLHERRLAVAVLFRTAREFLPSRRSNGDQRQRLAKMCFEAVGLIFVPKI